VSFIRNFGNFSDSPSCPPPLHGALLLVPQARPLILPSTVHLCQASSFIRVFPLLQFLSFTLRKQRFLRSLQVPAVLSSTRLPRVHSPFYPPYRSSGSMSFLRNELRLAALPFSSLLRLLSRFTCTSTPPCPLFSSLHGDFSPIRSGRFAFCLCVLPFLRAQFPDVDRCF